MEDIHRCGPEHEVMSRMEKLTETMPFREWELHFESESTVPTMCITRIQLEERKTCNIFKFEKQCYGEHTMNNLMMRNTKLTEKSKERSRIQQITYPT